jgi:hypothetical protein
MSLPAAAIVPERRQVHFTLNPKGGVGKSFISALIAQYLRSKNEPVQCFDADATTATFSSMEGLNVRRIEMLDGQSIDARRLDEVMEPLLTEDSHIVLDTGASTYTVFASYLIENNVMAAIHENGKRVIVHAIIAGGATVKETLSDFDALASQLPPDVDLVVWKNEHFGSIVSPDGKPFEDMQVYHKHRERLHAIIHLPQRTISTFGADIAQMMKMRQTFDEAIAAPSTRLMAKQRLTGVRRDVFEQCSHAF